ncbi:hypothetical protein [Arthrobacter pityocampae]|nr:hypothetical protein [Arthrobacter pityocampae]
MPSKSRGQEEFAPGPDPELLELTQTTADLEMADIDAIVPGQYT